MNTPPSSATARVSTATLVASTALSVVAATVASCAVVRGVDIGSADKCTNASSRDTRNPMAVTNTAGSPQSEMGLSSRASDPLTSALHIAEAEAAAPPPSAAVRGVGGSSNGGERKESCNRRPPPAPAPAASVDLIPETTTYRTRHGGELRVCGWRMDPSTEGGNLAAHGKVTGESFWHVSHMLCDYLCWDCPILQRERAQVEPTHRCVVRTSPPACLACCAWAARRGVSTVERAPPLVTVVGVAACTVLLTAACRWTWVVGWGWRGWWRPVSSGPTSAW